MEGLGGGGGQGGAAVKEKARSIGRGARSTARRPSRRNHWVTVSEIVPVTVVPNASRRDAVTLVVPAPTPVTMPRAAVVFDTVAVVAVAVAQVAWLVSTCVVASE